MKPFVGIGITTYRDISSNTHGAAVFGAYKTSIPGLVPRNIKVGIDPSRHAVSDANEFADLWFTEVPFEIHERRGGPLIDKGIYRVGAEWRSAGGGGGGVKFRSELRSEDPDTILIKHPYSARSDWFGLFQKLVDVCEPAHASLHIFTESEINRSVGDRFDRFDGPFAGEEWFVSWKSDLGEWRKPDRWEREARHTYKFLPELCWANFLGTEFDGQFQEQFLREHAAQTWPTDRGLMFSVTNNISDVLKASDHFDSSRQTLRAAFNEQFFRIQSRSL